MVLPRPPTGSPPPRLGVRNRNPTLPEPHPKLQSPIISGTGNATDLHLFCMHIIHTVMLLGIYGSLHQSPTADPIKTPVFHLGRSVCSCCHLALPSFLHRARSAPSERTHVLSPWCWTLCFLCRWRSCLERPSCRCHFSTFFAHFPNMFKIASLPTFLFLALSSKLIFSLRGPCGSCSCLLLRPP